VCWSFSCIQHTEKKKKEIGKKQNPCGERQRTSDGKSSEGFRQNVQKAFK
jgi:hypothetical protein